MLVCVSGLEGGIGNVRSDVLNRLWWRCKEGGVEIPFPQRDVYMRALPTNGAGADVGAGLLS